ncbi:hypothetical protein FQA39_LY08040 [Lamprigera yunnana]|nr:hypothetical protein FQA39_LY08040 [Lamprigera yunnana]
MEGELDQSISQTESTAFFGSANATKSLRKQKPLPQQALQTSFKDITEMLDDRLQYQEKQLAFLERAQKEAMTLLREENEIEQERSQTICI